MKTFENRLRLVWLPVLALVFAGRAISGGLSTQLGEVVVENLQIGQSYNLSQLANLKLLVTNTSEYPVNLKMDVLYPDSSELKLGARAIPDTSWIKLSQTSFRVSQNDKATSEILISIPNRDSFRGQKYQVTIWSHTIADENSGMTLAYGLKTRVIFTTDTAAASNKGAAHALAPRGDFSLKPQLIQLDNVQMGSLYDIEKEKGVVLEIANPSDYEQTYLIQSLPVSASVATLVDGFSDTPDASYLKFSSNEVLVGPNRTSKVQIYLDIPAREEYRGKRFMFVVRAVAKGGDVVASVYSRLLASVE